MFQILGLVVLLVMYPTAIYFSWNYILPEAFGLQTISVAQAFGLYVVKEVLIGSNLDLFSSKDPENENRNLVLQLIVVPAITVAGIIVFKLLIRIH